MKKRGQIAVFAVIAAVIILSTVLIIYIRGIRPEQEFELPDRSTVQGYVSSCVYDIGKEAIRNVANNGGYLELPESILYNPERYTPLIFEGDVYGTKLKAPNWYYGAASRIPSTQFMEDSISRRVEETIDDCLGDFEAFENKYIIERAGFPFADTIIGENTVEINLNYPLNVTSLSENTITQVDDFSVTYNAKLKKMIEFAEDILETENREGFVEQLTIDYMSVSPNIPFTEIFFTCERKMWYIQDIQNEIEKMITEFVPMIQIENSDHTDIPDWLSGYQQKNLLVNVGDTNYRDLKANFFYHPSWGLTVSSPKEQGGILKSAIRKPGQEMGGLIPFCIQVTQFVYDVDYNILTFISDPNAFGGEGLTLRFGIPIQLRSNVPDRTTDVVSLTNEFEGETDYEFCEDKIDPERNIIATDEVTGEELSNVSIYFNCITVSCDLGYTESTGRHYQVETKLPRGCSGGYISAKKEGYLNGFAAVEEEGEIYVEMTPLKEFNVTIAAYNMEDFLEKLEFKKGDNLIVYMNSEETGHNAIVNIEDLTDINQTIELIDSDAEYSIMALYSRGDVLMGGYMGDFEYDYDDVAGKERFFLKLIASKTKPLTDAQQADISSFLFDEDAYQNELKASFRDD